MDVVDSPRRYDPLALGQAVARNVVPVVGILAFGWPAIQVLLLYFIDTMLAMGVLFAGLASYFGRQSADGTAARINGEAGAIFVAVFLCAFIAVPLGMPLVFVGAFTGWEGFGSLWKDQAFLAGAAWQAAAAIWSCAGLWRELRVRTPEELRLKRRFGFVLARWVIVLFVVYSPIASLAGRFMPHLLVIVYAAASVFLEVAPNRLLRLMPGGENLVDPEPGMSAGTRAPMDLAGGAAARRRKRRDRG